MRRKAILCLLLAAVTLAVYWPVMRHGFTNFDEPDYILANLHVKAGLTWPGVVWAFTTGHANNWHPLTWLSHMLDCQLFGMNPTGHHATSLLLHLANSLLLFLLLLRLTASAGGNPKSEGETLSTNPTIHPPSPSYGAASQSNYPAFFVAALFALHPLHVESVAWLAERKDVLSTLFFLLTLWAYVRYLEERPLCVHRASAVDQPDPKLVTPSLPQRRDERRGKAANPSIHQSANPLIPSGAPLRFYVLALVFFALGLMSKPMLVTTPFVLLLLDYWPLRRVSSLSSAPKAFGGSLKSDATRPDPKLRTTDYGLPAVGSTLRSGPATEDGAAKAGLRTILEKLPFFALSIASCIVTLIVQGREGNIATFESIPAGLRIENALLSYVLYLKKLFWPFNLACYYPYDHSIATSTAIGAALLLLTLTLLLLAYARRRPYLLMGWLWYLGTLLPVIGLVQVGSQSMADRYTYIPSIGIFLLLVWAAFDLPGITHRAPAAPQPGEGGSRLAFATACVIACSILTRHQLGYWEDSETLFRHALAVTADNPIAELNLGEALDENGKVDEAEEHFRRALELRPGDAEIESNLGFILASKGKYAEAIGMYRAVLASRPHLAQTHYLLAYALGAQGNRQQAVAEYRLALESNPDHPLALNDLAWTLATCPDAGMRDGPEAVRLGERLCRITGFREAQFDGTLAAAYAEAGRFQEAVATAEKAKALASQAGQTGIAQRNEQLLELYRAGKPCRE